MSKASKQQDKLINLQAQQLAAQVANWAATLDFQKQRFQLLELPQFQQSMQLDVDKFAWQKAQDTWERAYQESLLTGMYQGQPTTQWLIDQAKLTGSYNGERTLEGLLTDAQIQDMHDKMKLANDEFLANATGYINGQKTFDRQKFEAAQALDGWKFISTLTGPQNAFKQARAIATMPGGLGDLMRAFAGQYMLPTGTAVGSGGAGGNNPAGQLSDMMLGFGGNQAPTAGQSMVTGLAASPGAAAPGAGTNAIVVSGPTGAPGMAAQQPYVPPPIPGVTTGGGGRVPDPIPLTSPYLTPGYVPSGTYPGAALPPPPASVAGGQYNQQDIPGRGIPSDQWDAHTVEMVNAWNTNHPGYEADGTLQGYHASAPQITPVYATGWAGEPQGYQAAYAAGGVTYSPEGVQAPVGAYNYSGTQNGSTAVYPPGVASPPQTPDISSQTPLNPAAVSSAVNQPYYYAGAAMAPVSGSTGLTLPNQFNLENWADAYQYQRDLTTAQYADAGWDPSLFQEAIQKSAPKYGGPTHGAIAF